MDFTGPANHKAVAFKDAPEIEPALYILKTHVDFSGLEIFSLQTTAGINAWHLYVSKNKLAVGS